MSELEALHKQLASKTLSWTEQKKVKARIEELEKVAKKPLPPTTQTLF